MEEQLNNIKSSALQEINSAQNQKELEAVKIKYLGRKGLIADLLNEMAKLSAEQKPKFGKLINNLKNDVKEILDQKINGALNSAQEKKIKSKASDITLPSRIHRFGHLHPLTQTMEEVVNIFLQMGFVIAEGPEVENDYYNFEALNFPPDHPAREMQDTFYLENGKLLRTHTSPVQIRVMEKQKPPLAVIMPGRVYRRDADVTHSPVFNQLEGLMVDKNITFADLKGSLVYFLHRVFGKSRRVRFRPSYFPFTEPSAEIDVECIICNGDGCRVCSGTGWVEILGAGMVDPNVFKATKIDSEKYTGFAFGMGIERIAMLKSGVDDIRLYYKNDIRFLEQF